ncbi:MAG TPA: hypothetical protein VGH86_04200, partial [Phenylobacterium sp.]
MERSRRPRRFVAAVALAAAALSLTQTAWASDGRAEALAPLATPTIEGLTVVAPKLEQEKLPDLVNRFVEAHSATSRIDQLSRWADPLCPATGGLTPAFNRFVTARVRAVSASVGAPVEKRPNRNFPCKTNLLIVFTTAPQALMDDVRKRHSQMLGFHYTAQAERLATVTHPIQAWYITGTKPEGGNVEVDDQFYRMPSGGAGSRLSSRLESQFMGVLVVVDATKIMGHQIGAIADNIAMLSLAHATQVEGCSDLPTILDFLNPDCPTDKDPPG